MIYIQCVSLSVLLLCFITANAVLYAEADPGTSQSQRHGNGAAIAAPRITGQGPAKRSTGTGHAFSKLTAEAAPKSGKEVGEARKKRCETGGCDDGHDYGDLGGGMDDSFGGGGDDRMNDYGGGGGRGLGGGITCQCTCDGLPIDADPGSGAMGRR